MDEGSRLPRRGPAKVIDWIQGLFSGVFHFFKGAQEDSVTEKKSSLWWMRHMRKVSSRKMKQR